MDRIARAEKLIDAIGVYGYGLVGDGKLVRPVILRPDRIATAEECLGHNPSMLQQIPPNFPIKYGRGSAEQQMAWELASSHMDTTGLMRPGTEEWRNDPEGWKVQCRHYFAALARSRQTVNKVFREVIEEATDPGILRLARRFPLENRYQVYCYISSSPRAAQIAETFPLLAYVLSASDICSILHQDAIDEARGLVEAGRRLRDVAAAVDVSMSLRNIRPGAVHLAIRGVGKHICHMPTTTRAQIAWWHLVGMALRTGDPVIVEWTCRNATQFDLNWRAARTDFSNILDWMNACNGQEQDGDSIRPDTNVSQLITRKLTPCMSVATVRQLSDDWHYDVAMADHGSNADFPDPWVPEGNYAGYKFVPIRTPAELSKEGRAMHNCVSSYVDRIVDCEVYVYSVRQKSNRVATLAIGAGGNRENLRPSISQIAGPCNASVEGVRLSV